MGHKEESPWIPIGDWMVKGIADGDVLALEVSAKDGQLAQVELTKGEDECLRISILLDSST